MKKAAKQPKPRRQRKKALKGQGDYNIVDLKAINDLDRRLAKFEHNYTMPTSNIGKAAHAAGSLLAGDLGGQAASALAKWFGHGDYDVKVNSLIPNSNGQMPQTGLKFEADGKRGFRVTDREYIGDIFSGPLLSGSSQFTNASYNINPGNPILFPWLSTIANQYEQYKPNGIVFEFVSTSSVYNGANQALGTVITATDYDPTDAPYASKIEMENADYAKSTKASESLLHGIECDLSERGDRVLLTRGGSVGTESLKFYDLGIFQIATLGMSAANVNLGELWVSYDITFYKKQLTQGQIGTTISTFTASASNSLTSNFFGGTLLKAGNMNVTLGTNTITFPPNIVTGRFLVSAYFIGGTVNVPTLSLTSNCVSTGPLDPVTWSNCNWTTPWGASQTSQGLFGLYIAVTGPSAVVTLSGGVLVSAVCQLLITQLPFNQLARIN